MGLSFSRSVRFGPVRFNFSGAGIGVSTGIKGLRIGTGPRGAYISAGRGGFRYRVSLGHGGRASPAAAGTVPAAARPAPVPIPGGSPNVVSTEQHDTLSVLALSDSNGDALLASMNEQAKKMEWWPFVAVCLFVLFLWARQFMATWPDWLQGGLFILVAGGVLWLRHYEKLQKLTVLFYEPDATVSSAYGEVIAGIQATGNVRKLQSITETATLADRKYEAGASRALKLAKASVSLGQAPGVVSNIDVPLLTSGRTTFAFYPDRVLAFQNRSVGAIDYGHLQVTSSSSNYVEKESLPGDATVVSHTWQYVNKNGGPDKRFKNNPQYPVCNYNQLRLSSTRGLDVRFQASRAGAFDEFSRAVQSMSGATG